jgi:thiamine biosynthesis lipoprotein
MTVIENTGLKRPLTLKLVTVGSALLAGSVTAILASTVAADRVGATVDRRAWVMGTQLSMTVESVDRMTAVDASEAALLAVAEVEARLSTWVEDSELSSLNRAGPGVDVVLSRQLEADLREASRWWRATAGAFDPGMASLVSAWDLRGDGRQPSAGELKAARSASGFAHLDLDVRVARVGVPGFGVEEGGFGKGIALRSAVEAARAHGADCAVFDFGGQIEVVGDCIERTIEIAGPGGRGSTVAELRMNAGSIATSGNSERGITVSGVRYSHILDPRSGLPAPDWGAVTVVTWDPVAADCVATALYVMGPTHGSEWVQGRPGIEAVFVVRRGERAEVIATSGLASRLQVFGENVTYLSPYQERIEERSH